ncbi:MAG: YdbH domain-containing protein [Pseudomonadota bacterium]
MRLLRWLSATFALLLTAAAILWFARFALAEWLIKDQIARLGLTIQTVEVTELGLNRTVIRGLALNPSSKNGQSRLNAGSIELFYHPLELISAKVRRIKVTDLSLGIDQDALDDLSKLVNADNSSVGDEPLGDPIAMPSIELENTQIVFTGEIGSGTLGFTGSLELGDGQTIKSSFSYQLDTNFGSGTGAIEAALGPDGSGKGDISIENGTLHLPMARAAGLSGTLNLSMADGEVARFSGDLSTPKFQLIPDRGSELPPIPLALTLTGDRDKIDFQTQAGQENGDLDFRLSAHAKDYLAAPTLNGNIAGKVTASPSWEERLTNEFIASMAPDRGQLALSLDFELSAAAPPQELLKTEKIIELAAELRSSAMIDLSLHNLAREGRYENLQGQINARVEQSGNTITIHPIAGTQAHVAGITPKSFESLGLPDSLIDSLKQGLEAQVIGSTSGKSVIAVTLGKEHHNLKWETGLMLAGSEPVLRENILQIQGSGTARLDARLDPCEAQGELVLGTRISELAVESVAMDGLSFEGPVNFLIDQTRARLDLPAPGKFGIDGLNRGLDLTLQSPLVLTLKQGSLEIPRIHDSNTIYDLDLHLASSDWALRSEDGKKTSLTVGAESLTLSGDSPADQPIESRLQIVDGHLTLPDQSATLKGIRADLALAPEQQGLLGQFDIERILYEREPIVVNPFGLKGELTRRGDELSLQATGSKVPGAEALKISGTFDPAKNNGSATVDYGPLVYQPGAVQPADLFPIFETLKDVTGNMSVSTEWQLDEGKLSSSGEIRLQDVSFRANDIPISAIDLSLELDDLLNPLSPADQRLTIEKIDPGLPVRDIALKFQVLQGAKPRLKFQSGSFSTLGAKLELSETLFDPEAAQTELKFQVRDLKLGTLFELIQTEGLSGSGTLEGNIPLVLDGDDLILKKSLLAAIAPGQLQFRSEDARQLLVGTGEEVDLLLQALEDFRYQDLSITFQKSANHDVEGTLSILGNNPEVLDGQAFRLNINLETNVGSFLAAFKQGYRVSYDAFRRAWKLRE